jgi:hypothetical protein
MLKNIPIASFPLGIDQLSDETSIPKGAARDMLNVDADNDGGFSTRSGFELVSAMTDAHSLWGSRDGSFGLYVHGALLKRMVVNDDVPLSATILTGLTLGAAMSFFEHANEVFFSNGHQLGVVTRTSCRLLGVQDPDPPGVAYSAAGTLPAGKYSLACSYVRADGEESGLSAQVDITLAAAGGLTVTLPNSAAAAGAVDVRIYCTPANGDVLYLAATAPVGLTDIFLGSLDLSKVADTRHLRRMPPGTAVRVFNGRLFTSRGDVLWFSEPFRYGLTSPRHNFVRFNSAITMIEPVMGGVFVGTQEAVYFLQGDGPGGFKQGLVSVNAPFQGSSTLVPTSALPKKLAEQGAGFAAVWLGAHGYSVGLPSGTALDVQSDRINLSKIEGVNRAVHFVKDGIKQVLSIVESTASAGPGSAVDSSI